MDRRFAELLKELRHVRFAELAGSRAAIDLTLPDVLINRALAALLEGSDGRLRGVTIAAQPGDRFHLELQLGRSFIPSIGVEVEIERQPELPPSPEVVFRWRTLLPGLATLVGSAAAFFQNLPPGVRLEGDRVFVDLRPLLDRAGAAHLLPLLAELHISTRQSAVDLHLVALGPVGWATTGNRPSNPEPRTLNRIPHPEPRTAP